MLVAELPAVVDVASKTAALSDARLPQNVLFAPISMVSAISGSMKRGRPPAKAEVGFGTPER